MSLSFQKGIQPETPTQVVDKSADSVLDEVESTIYQVAQQILRGEGFTYGIPSRSKGNQVYVPELDRIVLKDSKSQRPFASTSTCRKAVITTRILQLIHELCLKRIHVTKRDLFYTDVKLFEVGLHCRSYIHYGYQCNMQQGIMCGMERLYHGHEVLYNYSVQSNTGDAIGSKCGGFKQHKMHWQCSLLDCTVHYASHAATIELLQPTGARQFR